jgi:CspA family cold shock protein
MVRGIVRLWNAGEGWGVIDSPATPGGCFASFATLRMEGFRTLDAGQVVDLEFDKFTADGYDFYATAVEIVSE